MCLRRASLGDRDTAFVRERKRVDVVDRLLGMPGKHTPDDLDREQSTVTLGDSAKEFDVDSIHGCTWSQCGGNPAEAPTQPEEWADRLKERWQKGYQALDIMERHLKDRRFFVGNAYSIADIALYAYTHVAEQGDFDLNRYPAIRGWLDRVADQPGHVLITQSVFG